MTLSDKVSISRRFQRAIRIDTDLDKTEALEGFICPQSSVDVLLSMARHVSESGHGAFTWTGPYGSGKSSLIVALSALLSASRVARKNAVQSIGAEAADTVQHALRPKTKGYQVLPVVGRRESAAQVIGEAIEQAGLGALAKSNAWTDAKIVKILQNVAISDARTSGGLVLFIDEMGKFLEAAAQDGSDIYLFQLLAEAASRSNGRFIFVGVLHQAFEEYASRLSRDMRDEWSKIQGRFVDMAVNAAGEEQIELISRAIENGRDRAKPTPLAKSVTAEVRRNRPNISKRLGETLEASWPLHPVVTCLLGPISRRRFGQNQRSIFGFLNSAEPYGFQDFLRHATDSALYEPDRLWNYLRANLEPSILASPDGHRWAMAAEAVERCEALGGDAQHSRVLKSIALVDLFKERSGLTPSLAVISACVPDLAKDEIQAILNRLTGWSLITFRKFADAYAVYAGSDFDIERATREAIEESRAIDFSELKRLVGLQPVLAKRHYHETGALRWFDVEVAPVSELLDRADRYRPHKGTIGQFILAVPTEGESESAALNSCREAARRSKDWDIVVGLSQRSWAITDLAREVVALSDIQNDHPELAGDPVAQREVSARLSALQTRLEEELRKSLDNADWHLKHHKPKRCYLSELNTLASDLADRRFSSAPHLHNELLNRIKPSSNAVAAQNALLRQMVAFEGQERLGIEGFPAEGGLYASLLEATGLYQQTDSGFWRFVAPGEEDDPCGLLPLWQAASDLLKEDQHRTVQVSELYERWAAVPFGVKDGLMPVLAVAFILSRRDSVALYRQGVFQAQFKDIDVEILAKDPREVQLRWMDLSDISRRLLSSMAQIVRDLDERNGLVDLAPIDVARGLIAIYDRLHPWTRRTMQLSANAVRVRNLFKHANDPNKFLFDDIPLTFNNSGESIDEDSLGELVNSVRDGLKELVQAYPEMLHRFRDLMLAELQVPNLSRQSLAELSARAENIKQLSGDFHLDALAGRLSQFQGDDADIEGVASLAANKPPRDWTDPDHDRALLEITDLSQRFIRSESFARVKGRADKRHAMAVVVGVEGRPAPVHEEFAVTDSDRKQVDHLIERVESALKDADGQSRNVILAALAELSARYMLPDTSVAAKKKKTRKKVTS